MTSEQLEDFASCWIRELAKVGGTGDYNSSVVWMGFTAPLEQQWEFLLFAVTLATTDEQLGHIAAGPTEQLLSKHGESCIADFEIQSRQDKKFSRMLTGACQHQMSEKIWGRLKAIQALVSNPLEMNSGPA